MVKDDIKTPTLKVWNEAKKIFDQSPDWVTFYREVMGVEGIIRREFSSDIKQLAEFEATNEYGDIQHMLATLREGTSKPVPEEGIKVITVRLPKTVHESLMAEAHESRTSLNKLCISKLLQSIERNI